MIGAARYLGSSRKKDRKHGEKIYDSVVGKLHHESRHGLNAKELLNLYEYSHLIGSCDYNKAEKFAQNWFDREWYDFISFL
ncbi:MAG: hypothetical protein V3U72_00600 [Candidatus Aenigmarchaeota archaeon]